MGPPPRDRDGNPTYQAGGVLRRRRGETHIIVVRAALATDRPISTAVSAARWIALCRSIRGLAVKTAIAQAGGYIGCIGAEEPGEETPTKMSGSRGGSRVSLSGVSSFWYVTLGGAQ